MGFPAPRGRELVRRPPSQQGQRPAVNE
uniref:Uncharacterized protein n=1 Tax=Arundo donax TaxID=35708 RepID=A0A0A9HAL5_ARUDO